jgi:cytoskeletal protein RodZ
MDPIEKQERKREAFRRLRAQRRRAGELRGRVVAISLISFVVLWGVVFAQMATGNDPVLGNKQAMASAPTADKRHRTQAKEPPAEEESTDTEEPEPAQAASEAIESTDPEEVESQLVESKAAQAAEAAEIEAAEVEAAEAELAEVEVEPEPLTTSQS